MASLSSLKRRYTCSHWVRSASRRWLWSPLSPPYRLEWFHSILKPLYNHEWVQNTLATVSMPSNGWVTNLSLEIAQRQMGPSPGRRQRGLHRSTQVAQLTSKVYQFLYNKFLCVRTQRVVGRAKHILTMFLSPDYHHVEQKTVWKSSSLHESPLHGRSKWIQALITLQGDVPLKRSRAFECFATPEQLSSIHGIRICELLKPVSPC